MKFVSVFSLIVHFQLSLSFSQTTVEPIEKEKLGEVVTFLLSVNYSDNDGDYPATSAFYYDEFGNYGVNASNRWNEESLIDKVLFEVSRFSSYTLEQEVIIEKFDINELKEKILLNCSINHINMIDYNQETNSFLLRTYEMSDSSDEVAD